MSDPGGSAAARVDGEAILSEITRSWLDEQITKHVLRGKPPRNEARDLLVVRLNMIASIHRPDDQIEERTYPAHRAAQDLIDLADPAIRHWQIELESRPDNELAKIALKELLLLSQLLHSGVANHIEIVPHQILTYATPSTSDKAPLVKKPPEGSRNNLCDEVANLFEIALMDANEGESPGLPKDGPVTKLTAAFMRATGWPKTTPGSVEQMLRRMIRSRKAWPSPTTTNKA